MYIKVLSENTTSSEKFACEHGLSIYIQTEFHKILFDMGASGLFARNAEKLNLDLTQIDLAVISHGHYDHGGGLKTFLEINSNANVYLHNNAFDNHYSNRQNDVMTYIGLDQKLLPNDRFIFCHDNLIIDEELQIFSNVAPESFLPSANANLMVKNGDDFYSDNFKHEQNLIVNLGKQSLLIAGCAHNGIINILNHYKSLKGRFPDCVIGGFHLYNRSKNFSESADIVDKIGDFMLKTNAMYYTCHCTGAESYNRLKLIMGDKIKYISAGEEFEIFM